MVGDTSIGFNPVFIITLSIFIDYHYNMSSDVIVYSIFLF